MRFRKAQIRRSVFIHVQYIVNAFVGDNARQNEHPDFALMSFVSVECYLSILKLIFFSFTCYYHDHILENDCAVRHLTNTFSYGLLIFTPLGDGVKMAYTAARSLAQRMISSHLLSRVLCLLVSFPNVHSRTAHCETQLPAVSHNGPF